MSAPEGPPGAEPDEAELFEQLANVRVEQLVAEAASSLVTVGFVRTGLVPEAPDALDLAQARVAIDAVAGLLRSLEGTVAPAALHELKGALAQLQLAYARQVEQHGAPPGPPPGAPPPGSAPPPPPQGGARRPLPPRPKIWTPRGEI